jgi:CheY-like chemotaxis protein
MKDLEAQPNLRVLVIDDTRGIHDDIRKILCPVVETGTKLETAEAALFGESGLPKARKEFQVDSAYQGSEGLAMVEKSVRDGRPYAMAFMDLRMPPGWDGIETTSKIWAVDPEVELVICTAFSDYSRDEMIARIDYPDQMLILKKPFDSMEVLQLAHALTEKWRLHRRVKSRVEQIEKSVQARILMLEETVRNLQAELAKFKRATTP